MVVVEPQVDTIIREIGGWIDRDNGSPLYLQIASLMRERIESNALKPGDVLPVQSDLAQAWGIGEVTIRRALQTLAKDDLIESRPRHGTVVTNHNNTAWSRDGSKALQIGIAFADFEDGYPFLQPILTGVRDDNCNIAVRLFDIPFREQSKTALADMLPLSDLHGLIMMSPANLRVVSFCQGRRLPVVLMFSDLADGFSHCVIPNYASGTVEAINHYAESGRERFALVTAGADRFSTGRWIEAFETALQAKGLKVNRDHFVRAGYSEYEGARATRELLQTDTPPDTIIYASEAMARGGLLAAQEAGIRTPEDLTIIGTGRAPGESKTSTTLPTIDLGLKNMGRLARNAIQATLEGRADEPLRQSVASRFHATQADYATSPDK